MGAKPRLYIFSQHKPFHELKDFVNDMILSILSINLNQFPPSQQKRRSVSSHEVIILSEAAHLHLHDQRFHSAAQRRRLWNARRPVQSGLG